MYSDEEIRAARDRAVELLMSLPGVTAVGIGGRERGGEPTGEIVLRVYVERKKPRQDVPPEELIPAEIDGVPTDVAEMGRGELVQLNPPAGRPTLTLKQSDDKRYRPLRGGGRMRVDMPGSGLGTLGCLLEHKTDPTKKYALTAWHVLEGELLEPTVGSTRAGQPSEAGSITKCCSNLIGVVAGGGLDTERDEGVVELDPGMEWLPEIIDIGPVRGVHVLRDEEVRNHTYQVRKRGMLSRLTGGTVDSIGTTVTLQGGAVKHNAIVVKPNPNPLLPATTPLWFVQGGDSGAALVNNHNEVVGLIFARAAASMGWALPIDGVLGRLEFTNRLPLKVATPPPVPAPVGTVPGAARVAVPPELVHGADYLQDAAPATTAWLPGVAPPTPGTLGRLQADLDRSEAGRLLIGLWLEHQRELTGLLEKDRRTAAAWHRAGGPALMQTLVRMMDQPAMTLPGTVHDVPLPMLFERLHDLFAGRASAALREQLARVKDALPDLSGLTYPQIIDRLSAAEAG
ncbi:hypothetical protein AB0K09_27550 [Streptomyces sp. NPDC049577]|uniref:hypothetical protein n=1 Tax=Streptomyces sp. NPDC049577 TaxID=3155153 RepID=UPI00344AA747